MYTFQLNILHFNLYNSLVRNFLSPKRFIPNSRFLCISNISLQARNLSVLRSIDLEFIIQKLQSIRGIVSKTVPSIQV